MPTLPSSSQLLNPRELQVFLTVAELGSVGKAATALHLTQPALSRIVKRLEQQLGVLLFERHPHGVALTAFGRRLEPYAQLMLSESARAVQELSAMRGQPQGTVRLGSVASGFSGYVPTAVERLLQRSPDLHVRLVEGVTEELLLQLARGDIDMALAFSVPVADDIATVSRSEWQTGNHIVAGSAHPLCGAAGLALRDLLGERWALAPRGTQPRSEFMQLFAEHRLDPPQAVVETGSIIAMRQLIARGGFLGWMPRP